jgi:hypothetical protein
MGPTTRLLQSKNLAPNDGMVLQPAMYVQDNFQLGTKRKGTSHRTKTPRPRALLPRSTPRKEWSKYRPPP